MKILDCESPGTAYGSVETITGLNADRLNTIFDEYTPSGRHSPCDELFSIVLKLTDATAYDRVCMFHFTRLPESADFGKGILPLQGRWIRSGNLCSL